MKNDELKQDGADRLVGLRDLKDYKVAKDSPDVAGWRVIGANGETLGMVQDLIVDLQAMKTRYLSVVADRKFFNNNDDQYLLIPIGAAALDKKGRNVFVSHLDANSITNYPVYPGGPIREDYEYAVRENFLQNNHFTTGNPAPSNTETVYTDTNQSTIKQPVIPEQSVNKERISNDFYDNNQFNENQFYTADRDNDRNSTIIYTSSQDTNRNNQGDFPRQDTPVYNDKITPDTNTPGSSSKSVEESIATIERLEQLRERGSITEEEFRTLKKKAINF